MLIVHAIKKPLLRAPVYLKWEVVREEQQRCSLDRHLLSVI